MATETWNREQALEGLVEWLDHRIIFNGWLQRGDGLAVYENHHFGHPELGHRKIVSFGSHQAQLETDEPPMILPDIGNEINWRYVLIATYRGAPL